MPQWGWRKERGRWDGVGWLMQLIKSRGGGSERGMGGVLKLCHGPPHPHSPHSLILMAPLFLQSGAFKTLRRDIDSPLSTSRPAVRLFCYDSWVALCSLTKISQLLIWGPHPFDPTEEHPTTHPPDSETVDLAVWPNPSPTSSISPGFHRDCRQVLHSSWWCLPFPFITPVI